MVRRLFSLPMIGGSMTHEIAAAPDVVWETITDYENATSILTNLLQQEIIHGNEHVDVGTVVREKRTWGKRETTLYRTITAVSTKPPLHYSISTNIHLTRQNAVTKQRNAARTGSWTIVPGNSKETSALVWAHSAIPESVGESLAILLFGRLIIRSIQKHFQEDLQDFGKEAERRQALRDSCGAGVENVGQ